MAITKIATVTVGAGGASSIDFTSIPGTMTDLMIELSGRSSRTYYTNDEVIVRFNGSTSGYSYKELQGNGSSASSFGNTNNGIYRGAIPTAAANSNTFSNNVIYVPNYAGATNKSVSLDTTSENTLADGGGSTYTRMVIIAGLWANTAAITSLTLTPEVGTFVQYSTATLYGITKGSLAGVTVS